MNIYLTVVLGTRTTGPTNVDVAVEQYLAVHDSGAAALGAAMIDFAAKYPNYSILQPRIPSAIPVDQIKELCNKVDYARHVSEIRDAEVVDHSAGD